MATMREELAALRAKVAELEAFRRLVTSRLLGDVVMLGTGRGRAVRVYFQCHTAPAASSWRGVPYLLADPLGRVDADGVLIPPVVVAVDPTDGTVVSGGRWRVDQAASESPDSVITSFTLPTTPISGTITVYDDGTYQGAPSSVSGRSVTLAYAPDTGVALRFCYQEAS